MPPRLIRAVEGYARMLRAELRSPLRFRQPALVLRGFNSDRRWLYPDFPSCSGGYISDAKWYGSIKHANPPDASQLFEDKLQFAHTMSRSGLEEHLPSLLAIVSNGGAQHRDAGTGGPVVRKPNRGKASQGVAFFDRLDDAIATCPEIGEYLIQEQVVAHRSLRAIFPDSTNALRVLTHRRSADQSARIVRVVQRISTSKSAPFETLGTGGVAAQVDAAGRMSSAVLKPTSSQRVVLRDHPDTGMRIEGRSVPYIREACSLALHAMNVIPTARVVAWDIAVTDNGPILLEGNASWPNLAIFQAFGPLATEIAPDHMLGSWDAP